MAASSFKLVSQNAPAANEAQDFTSSGFGTPTAALFFYGEGGVDSSGANFSSGMGATDGTDNICVVGYGQDAATARNTPGVLARSFSSTYAGYFMPTSYRTAFASLATDKATLTWAGGTAQQPYVSALLIKCNAAKVGTFTASGTLNGDVNVTGLGFTPKLVIIFCGGETVDNNVAGGLNCTYGFALDNGASIDNGMMAKNSWSGSGASNPHGYCSNTYCGGDWDTSTFRSRLGVTAMASGQFTVRNYGPTGASTIRASRLYYLALDIDESVEAFDYTTPTSASSWGVAGGGLSGTPLMAMMLGGRTASYDSMDSGTPGSETNAFYIHDGSDGIGHSSADEDSVADTVAWDVNGKWTAGYLLTDNAGTSIVETDAPTLSPTDITFPSSNMTVEGTGRVGVGFSLYSASTNTTITVPTGPWR